MILVCGGLADSVTELVCARLEACRYPYRLLDLGFYPEGYQVSWRWEGLYPTGTIATADWRLDLQELSGAFVRYLGMEGRQPPAGIAPEFAQALQVECDAGVAALVEHLPCAVANRMRGGLSNHSKPFQALLVRRYGLHTPPTLVTTDAGEAQRFYERHDGQVIYKSISGVRSIVKRLSQEQLDRLRLLQNGPAQFQAFIPGENVRVHTVGEEIFATRVHSESVDYRYSRQEGHTTEMEPVTLPPAIGQACLRLARALGLLIAGIDLKETPEGEYYCFEVNPSPGFLYYEHATGQPISRALADLLHKGLPASAWEEEMTYTLDTAEGLAT